MNECRLVEGKTGLPVRAAMSIDGRRNTKSLIVVYCYVTCI